jgi:hypothetical protein
MITWLVRLAISFKILSMRKFVRYLGSRLSFGLIGEFVCTNENDQVPTCVQVLRNPRKTAHGVIKIDW